MKNLKIKSVIMIALAMSISNVFYAQHDHSKMNMTHQNKVEVQKTEPVQDYKVGSEIPKELVCMVNNKFMGKAQIPVPVNGKTYYGCCQMCVGTLNNDEKSRIGKDPYSNKPIDKTAAYIVLMDKDGKVDYFESKENYLRFTKK